MGLDDAVKEASGALLAAYGPAVALLVLLLVLYGIGVTKVLLDTLKRERETGKETAVVVEDLHKQINAELRRSIDVATAKEDEYDRMVALAQLVAGNK